MRRQNHSRALLLPGAWLALLACGSRTGLVPGRETGSAGAAGSGVAGSSPMPEPECVTAVDCPQPPPGQCGTASCDAGTCALALGPVCDDGDPCTLDSCDGGSCRSESARVDADGDGVFASGIKSDPRAQLGCGLDCDDSSSTVFPGAMELCDALDNDCNGVIDDNTSLVVSGMPPIRVSPMDATRSSAAGLAFDGQSFGASMTSTVAGRNQGQFQQISSDGKLVGPPQRIARVNAESYGGPLVWSGERYLTAYEDARQDDNYEIYFDQLNRNGERVIEDVRVTIADDYSLRPSVMWTGAEALVIWDDRRFGDPALFGQRISASGELLGNNQRLTPVGVRAEAANAALSDGGVVGVAFMALDGSNRPRLSFTTAGSRILEQSGPVIDIPFDDPDRPVVTPLINRFAVTFNQYTGSFIGPSVYGVLVDEKGLVSPPLPLTSGAAHARGNATFSFGDRLLMVWADDSQGTYQLFAQQFDQKLAPIGARQRVTTTMSNTVDPVVAPAANGSLGILYTDEVSGTKQTFFTQLLCVGAPARF